MNLNKQLVVAHLVIGLKDVLIYNYTEFACQMASGGSNMMDNEPGVPFRQFLSLL